MIQGVSMRGAIPVLSELRRRSQEKRQRRREVSGQKSGGRVQDLTGSGRDGVGGMNNNVK